MNRAGKRANKPMTRGREMPNENADGAQGKDEDAQELSAGQESAETEAVELR